VKHNLARPCKTCPFRNDVHPYLRKARVLEIVESICDRQESFPCHKTVNYNSVRYDEENDEEFDRDRTGESQCAGAEIFLAHQGTSSQLARIAERLGMASKLDMKAPVCKSVDELLRVHGHKPDKGDFCSVADDGCQAPCGYGGGGGISPGRVKTTLKCWHCGDYVCASCSIVRGGKRMCGNCQERERINP
jgi:hypothetical protein